MATWIVTGLVVFIIYSFAITLLITEINKGNLGFEQSKKNVYLAIILFAFVPVVGLFAPVKFCVDSLSVTVCRFGPDVVIPKDSIVEVKRVRLRFVWRTFGVGGLFGAWGWFRGSPLGTFLGYMTRRDNSVVLIRKAKAPVVLTPSDPDMFIDVVQAAFNLKKVS